MDKSRFITRRLARAALFSLVRGIAWAAGSGLAGAIAWWVHTL
ncbi:hypothetical protein ACFWHQ_14265 [Streptomyces sp. NPDC060334]